MNLIDVVGEDQEFVNLDLVRRIRMGDHGQEASITFSYVDGSEDTFTVSSGRLRVLQEALVARRIIY